MTKPPEVLLAQERVHRRDPSLRKNVIAGYMVLPLDIQDMPQAEHVEGVESMFLAHVGGPCLTAIKECAEDACLVDMHLGVLPEEAVLPHLLGQFGHGG